jgi:DNA (cytosine-5)-methyltransferase 1
MWWNRPAATLTTRFNSLSNGRFGHPNENRAISVREGASLQTFPRTYFFAGTAQSVCRQVGNAVPPALAEAIGRHLLALHRSRHEEPLAKPGRS